MHVKYNSNNGHVVRVSAEPFDTVEIGYAVAEVAQRPDDTYPINPRDEIMYYISVNAVDEDNIVTSYSAILQSPPVAEMIGRIGAVEDESLVAMLALTEVYETTSVQGAALEQESVDTMLALTEAYETILLQQSAIEALEARVAALEGGGE